MDIRLKFKNRFYNVFIIFHGNDWKFYIEYSIYILGLMIWW